MQVETDTMAGRTMANSQGVCVLTAAEARRWNHHKQPPSRCERRKHGHVGDERARELCAHGNFEAAFICGKWRLVPINVKKAWRPTICFDPQTRSRCITYQAVNY